MLSPVGQRPERTEETVTLEDVVELQDVVVEDSSKAVAHQAKDVVTLARTVDVEELLEVVVPAKLPMLDIAPNRPFSFSRTSTRKLTDFRRCTIPSRSWTNLRLS